MDGRTSLTLKEGVKGHSKTIPGGEVPYGGRRWRSTNVRWRCRVESTMVFGGSNKGVDLYRKGDLRTTVNET